MFLESINIFHHAHASSSAGIEPTFEMELTPEKVLIINHQQGKIDNIRIKYGRSISFNMRPSPNGISKIKLKNLPPGKVKVELVRQGKIYSKRFIL